ncbi:hypothetical protein D5086_013673 [Populus alba]|uniref:Uncharacterized protein n=1 Tax=Populus alba TaxID=43335 RepID=A0ACC4C6F7_POPAL
MSARKQRGPFICGKTRGIRSISFLLFGLYLVEQSMAMVSLSSLKFTANSAGNDEGPQPPLPPCAATVCMHERMR